MTCVDDEWLVRMRLWIGFREDLYTTFDTFSNNPDFCATKNASFLIFLQCVDHVVSRSNLSPT